MPEDFTVVDFYNFLASKYAEVCNSPPSDGASYPNAILDWTIEKWFYNDILQFIADRCILNPEMSALEALDDYRMWLSGYRTEYSKGTKMYEALDAAMDYTYTFADDIWGSWR